MRWRPRRWGHWTLRSRLVLVVGALAAVALIVVNFAGLLLIRSYQRDRIDDQLRSMTRGLSGDPRGPGGPGGPGGGPFGPGPFGPPPGSGGGPYSPSPAASPTASPGGSAAGPSVSAGASPTGAGSPNGDAGGFSPRMRFPRLGPDQIGYLYDANGALDARSSTADANRPAVPSLSQANALAAAGDPFTTTARDGSADWRLIAVRDTQSGDVAIVGLSLSEVQQTTKQLLLIDAGVSVLVLALLGVGAAFVVRLGLRPLTEMEWLATDISAGNLSGRVAEDPHTEPGRLGVALNSMLNRIEAEVDARTTSEQRLRQFVADASHELRTPLTSIRGFAELYRRGGAPPGPVLDETMSRIEGEAGRMGVLVEDLLMLARLDRQRPPAQRPVDLLEIAADTIRDAAARVPGRPVRLAGLSDDTDTFEPATVLGDEHGLRQVATNLVANALQHTPPAAGVTVRVGRLPFRPPHGDSVLSGPAKIRTGALAVLEISDDGPGVPALHAPRIFERLYRADSSRTRGTGGGSGLGLSIVAAIVHGHGGWVELDTRFNGGSTFRVLLPSTGDTA